MQIKGPEPVLLQKNEVTGVGKGFQVWFTATEAPTVPRRYVDTTRVRRGSILVCTSLWGDDSMRGFAFPESDSVLISFL